MGNQVYEGSALTNIGTEGTRQSVNEFLERTQWPGDEEILVVAWEETSVSPSTQMWIPPAPDESPRLQLGICTITDSHEPLGKN